MSAADTKEPAPKPGREAVYPKVLADIQARIDMGFKKHGTYLETFNGRDALTDAYQEAIDLVFYLAQVLEERDGNKNNGGNPRETQSGGGEGSAAGEVEDSALQGGAGGW